MSHQPYYDTPNHLGPPGPSQGRPFSAGPSQPYSRSRSRSPPRRRDDPYGAPPLRRDDDGGGYPGGVGYTRSSGFAREDPYHGGSGVRSGPPGGVGGRDRWPNDRYNQGGPSTEPGAPPGWGVDHYGGGPRGPPPVQRGPGWLDPRQEAPWPQHNGGGSYGPVLHQPPTSDSNAFPWERPQPERLPPKRQGPSEPSRHIIFLGLDNQMSENDLYNFLIASGAKVESTTIIKDKVTGFSRGFGFALFAHTTAAAEFLEAHYPQVLIPFGDQPPRRVKIDFSASTNTPGNSGAKHGWGVSSAAATANDGTRDIASGAPGSVLLLRGVDPITRWEEVLQVLIGLEEGGKGVRRLLGLKDRATGSSWGFCFVEMRSVEFAKQLLAHAHSPTANPAGFQVSRISSKPVSVSFANPLAFEPRPAGGIGCIEGSVKGVGSVDGWVKYWDDGAAVIEVWAPGWKEAEAADRELEAFLSNISAELPGITEPEPTAPPAGSKPAKRSLATVDAIAPISLKIGKIGPDKPARSVFESIGSEEPDLHLDEKALALAKGNIRIPPIVSSRKVASSINKWNTKQSELAADPPLVAVEVAAPTAPQAAARPPAAVAARPIPSASTSSLPEAASSTISADSAEFEYSDLQKNACLLCQRMLKSRELLAKHNQASDLHKKNLLDANLRAVAKERVIAALAAQQPEYRDRASERRIVFNQPEKAPPQPRHPPAAGGGGATGKRIPGPPPPAPLSAPGPAPGEDESNIGNKMLAKMGWTKGEGLGLSGEGRVEPVKQFIVAPRSGLGAGGSKVEAGQSFGDRNEYANRARAGARERF